MDRDAEMLWKPEREPAEGWRIAMIVVAIAVWVVPIGYVALRFTGVVPRKRLVLPILVLAAAGVSGAVGAAARESSQRILRRHKWLMCLRCCYPLEERMERCPECGQVFEAAQVKQVWKLHYRRKR